MEKLCSHNQHQYERYEGLLRFLSPETEAHMRRYPSAHNKYNYCKKLVTKAQYVCKRGT